MKVDFVFPTVFPNDIIWQKELDETCKRLNRKSNKFGARYRDYGLVKYLFRAIENFMPWIDQVHLILARPSQVQPWMNTENIHIVFHKEIIPLEFLPTYNSGCIEMFLKNIPGLSEYFLYANDDMLPIEPMKVEDFFKDGKPCIRYKKDNFTEDASMYLYRCHNGLKLISSKIETDFEVDKYILKSHHSISPMLKSTHQKVWELYKDEIVKNIYPFRTYENLNQFIFSYYQILTNNYCDRAFKRRYTEFSDKPIDEICKIIKEKNSGVLCVNDTVNGNKDFNFELYKYKLNEAFESILPNKSKYEL